MCAKEHAGWLAHVLGVSEPVQCGLVRVPACARQRAPAATRTPPQLTHSDDQFACAPWLGEMAAYRTFLPGTHDTVG